MSQRFCSASRCRLWINRRPSCTRSTPRRGSHTARTILIAAGVGAFSAKTLPLPNAASFEKRGLYYFVKEVSAFRGKNVLIVGGGDSAVDWANMLAPVAQKVTLIHRRNEFRAHEDSVAQMRRSPVDIGRFTSSSPWMARANWRRPPFLQSAPRPRKRSSRRGPGQYRVSQFAGADQGLGTGS